MISLLAVPIEKNDGEKKRLIKKICSGETGMNASSHPKHENRIYEVSCIRASLFRHSGAMRFIKFDFAQKSIFFESF